MWKGAARLRRHYVVNSAVSTHVNTFILSDKDGSLVSFYVLTYIYNFITESGPFLTHLSLLGVMSFPSTELRADDQ